MRVSDTPMVHREIGMGLFQWNDDEIAFVGGMRCHGYHPPGRERMFFSVLDVPSLLAGKDQDTARLGKVEMIVVLPAEGEEPKVESLIVLEVDRPHRGQGHGRRIVSAVLKLTDGELAVHDIRMRARNFWRHLGVDIPTDAKGRISGTLRAEPVTAPRP